MFDVIIVGAGPAGLTAAIYASRRALKTLVISSDIGGQVTKTFDIENYPGFERISGAELATKFKKQAEQFGAEVIIDESKKISLQGDTFNVKTARNDYQAKSLILAFGKKPRQLDIPGEDEFRGKGVTYCATCDAPFFKNKTVAVVGGGNSALDAALLASKISTKVFLIHRSDQFRGEQHLIDQVNATKNIEKIVNAEIESINGENVVKSIKLKDGRELALDGIMVEIGYIVDRSLVLGLVDLDEKNQVIVNESQATSIPGIFAAGDLTPTPYKQIVISAGEGAKAALAAFDYIQKQSGKKGISADWH